jgi:glutathione peroxidase
LHDRLHDEVAAMSGIYDFQVQTASGEFKSLAEYRGQVMLIVNTASTCGFTPQYRGLETLYRKYASQGFVVLGFPCNQFGAQEPGDITEIQNFCSLTYDVTFPLFAKINVNGSDASPLFQHLKSAAKGVLGSEAIKWNFTKFLVDRHGAVRGRYAPATTPESLEKDIKAALP